MVGFVLRVVDKISYGLSLHNILLVDGIKNVFSYAKLSHPLNWTLTNLPVLSPIFLVILVSIVFILLYLYKTSELMSKKKLTWMLIIVIFIFLLANTLIILRNRPPEVKFRLTLFPIQSDLTSTRSSWIGNALWTITAQQLQRSVVDQAIVSPVEWTYAVVNLDSVHNLNYLTNLSQQIQAEYLLIGKLSGNDASPYFTYQMVQTNDGQAIINGSFVLTPQKLPELSFKICTEILNYFNITAKDVETFITYISSDAYQQYVDGENYFQQNNYQSALDLAQRAIAADSNLVEAFLLAGKSYLMKGLEKKTKGDSPIEEFERARELLSRTVELDSSRDEAYAFLGEYYVYRERWSLSEQMLAKAYHLNPNNPRLYLSLSRLHKFRYQKLGFENEEQLFKRAIFINPCYEDGYLMLADFYLFENRREQAIQVLEQILEINPDSVPALMALGKIYLVRRDILKIIEIYNRVIELKPNNSDAFYNLGILYYNSEDFDNAEKFLLRAIAIDNHLNANLYLAYLYEVKGDYDKAIEYLRRRIRYRKGLDDEFAEEARKHLVKLIHRDTTEANNDSLN